MPSPPPAEPPAIDVATQGGHRRRDIQGLRMIAVLMVVAFHAGLPLPGGFVGVDVFFVISGFVITGMLHRQWLATGRIQLGQFYIRRFKRLMPALALMVTVTVVLSAFVLSPLMPQRLVSRTAIGAILITANVVIARSTGGYFDLAAATDPLLNTWSLSVEEQFYLVFPPLLILGWVLARKARGRPVLPTVLVGLAAVVSFGLAALGSRGLSGDRAMWLLGFFSPFTRAWEFAVGALLALTAARVPDRWRAMAVLPAIAGLVLLAASALVISSSTPFPGPWTLLPVTGTLLLLWAGTQDGNAISRVLATGPAVRVGDWSYSIYLWHWPFIAFAVIIWPAVPHVAAVAALVSFLPALASFHWVEQPLRRMRMPSRPRMAVLVAATLVPPLAVAGTLVLQVHRGWGDPRILAAYSAQADPRATLMACTSNDTGGGSNIRDPAACTFGAGAPGRPVYLIGDSNASMYIEAVTSAGTSLDRPVTVWAAAGCPVMDIYRSTTDGWQARDDVCRSFYESTMRDVRADGPGTVVLATSTGYWTDALMTIGRTRETLTNDLDARAGSLAGGLAATVADLRAMGNDVVLVEPIYRFDDAVPVTMQQCSLWGIKRGECPSTVPLSGMNPRQDLARAAVADIAADTGATRLDIRDYQCPDGICGSTFNGVPVYMDTGHISSGLSQTLTPVFADALTTSAAKAAD